MIHTDYKLYPKTQQYDARNYVVCEDFFAKVCGIKVLVKEGFVYDGFSVPRLFHWFQSPFTGLGTVGALIHDALYASELVERKTADLIFVELMKMYGVGWIRRNMMYSAVRSWGWIVWARHKQEDVDYAKTFILIETKDA